MSLWSVCVFAVVVAVVGARADPAESKYTTKYDNVNLDQILSNDRLLSNYFKCLIDQGPCTSEGEELKGKCQ